MTPFGNPVDCFWKPFGVILDTFWGTDLQIFVVRLFCGLWSLVGDLLEIFWGLFGSLVDTPRGAFLYLSETF